MIRVFALKEKSGMVNLEYAMIWRGFYTPTLADFKTHWGDLMYEPWHEDSTAIELVPKDGSPCIEFDDGLD